MQVSDIYVEHYFADKQYTKLMKLSAGQAIGKHTHSFSHLSILGMGRAKVITPAGAIEYTAPACIMIAANVPHVVEALTDITWFCIHATDETDPEKIDEVLLST